ncbi:helicase-related protein [Lactobacillus sp. ESL0791]|uniref:helicase-related protein n=1 Tax=Lactobacillus sp. ESL0791 TaxID=2983234 RepID=UPI0023F71FE2|nr:helicase-related protein [Lactobacillus sp. ESL0791]MDF7638571.1 helicase-related protein [Lactobacillus sp. ESL0791]
MKNLTLLAGRQWPAEQGHSSILAAATQVNIIENGRCQRCGAFVSAKLPNGKLYCRACIGIGRAVEGNVLVRYLGHAEFPKQKNGGLTWSGHLTSQQEKISAGLVTNFLEKKNSLVHAVTGAGKTEMLFQLIAECMKNGQRACIATPRIDVVNELYPRFKAAFSEIKIGKYHGREFKEPDLDQLTICTTHQLLKFYQAFDLLVIDEVDSFPYVGDPQLHFGAKNAVKTSGVRVYLTATPTADLLEEVKQKKLRLLKLNRRFHGGLLPVPKEKFFLRPFLQKERLHSKLLSEIIKAVESGHPLLLFVPRIEQIPVYLAALRKEHRLQKAQVAGVYAADKQRLEKVAAFREQRLQILVTTTILERGVTFPHVWVIVVAADDAIYTTASLVQIAGRVGRAQHDPTGLVVYCYHQYTKNIKLAVRQIREMNR